MEYPYTTGLACFGVVAFTLAISLVSPQFLRTTDNGACTAGPAYYRYMYLAALVAVATCVMLIATTVTIKIEVRSHQHIQNHPRRLLLRFLAVYAIVLYSICILSYIISIILLLHIKTGKLVCFSVIEMLFYFLGFSILFVVLAGHVVYWIYVVCYCIRYHLL